MNKMVEQFQYGGLEAFIEISIDATIVINECGVISYVNSRAEKLLGYTRDELLGQTVEMLVPESVRANHSSLRQSFYHNQSVREMGKYLDLKAQTKSGTEIPVSISLSPFQHDGDKNYTLVSIRDNSMLHEAKERIDDYIAELRNITETAIDAIITMDSQSNILSWNGAACSLFGYSEEEAKGQLISIIIPQKMRKGHFDGVDNIASGGQSKIVGKTVEVEGLRKSGETFPLSLSITSWQSKHGRVFCGILRDITQRVEAEKKITEQFEQLQLISITDPLTGAFNRRQFDIVGGVEFSRAKRKNQPYTILMLDIDHFKAINDTYGHDVGDNAIIETVVAIKNTIRHEDSLFRIGGEEFAVLLPETSSSLACALAERVRVNISNINMQVGQSLITFTISIGVAEFSLKDENIDATLKRADTALYRAKSLGRDRVEL